MTDLAYLISRSCTTGWLDWVHGELWLLPDGLVRSRLGLAGTIANGIGRTVPDPLPHLPTVHFDHGRILAAHRTNKVIPFGDVASATLFRGTTANGLRLTMLDDRRHKLLWLVRDPAFTVLGETLPRHLGTRFTVR